MYGWLRERRFEKERRPGLKLKRRKEGKKGREMGCKLPCGAFYIMVTEEDADGCPVI